MKPDIYPSWFSESNQLPSDSLNFLQETVLQRVLARATVGSTQARHLLSVWPWPNCLMSLGLSFLSHTGGAAPFLWVLVGVQALCTVSRYTACDDPTPPHPERAHLSGALSPAVTPQSLQGGMEPLVPLKPRVTRSVAFAV